MLVVSIVPYFIWETLGKVEEAIWFSAENTALLFEVIHFCDIMIVIVRKALA